MTRRPTLTNRAYWGKTDAELHYILRDASEAAQHMKGLDPQAEAKYLEQVCDASTVLGCRRRAPQNDRYFAVGN